MIHLWRRSRLPKSCFLLGVTVTSLTSVSATFSLSSVQASFEKTMAHSQMHLQYNYEQTRQKLADLIILATSTLAQLDGRKYSSDDRTQQKKMAAECYENYKVTSHSEREILEQIRNDVLKHLEESKNNARHCVSQHANKLFGNIRAASCIEKVRKTVLPIFETARIKFNEVHNRMEQKKEPCDTLRWDLLSIDLEESISMSGNGKSA